MSKTDPYCCSDWQYGSRDWKQGNSDEVIPCFLWSVDRWDRSRHHRDSHRPWSCVRPRLQQLPLLQFILVLRITCV